MNMAQLIAFSPVISISGAVLVVMLTIAVRRNFVLVSFVAVIGILVSLSVASIIWNHSPIQVTPLIRVDNYGLFYTVLVFIAGLAVIAFSYDYFKDREGENEELLLLILTSLLGASVLVNSSHFASFFIGLETLSVSLFVLIGYSFDRPKSLEAAVKYLVLSGVSSAFLLMGMALIYAQAGTLEFTDIGNFIANQQTINAMVLTGIILMISGLAFKLSLVPFHLWTPDVYEGAPAPVTALVATVSKGAVFVLLLRYFLTGGGYLYSSMLTIFSIIAGVTILGGNLLALLQTDVKRMLAYSSIAHMGYLLVAFIAGGSIAPNLVVESVTIYLTAYIVTTLGAFGVVSILSTIPEEAGEWSFYQGLFWRRPWLAAVFTLMLLSLAGIPLTAGFIGKFYIFAAGVDGRLWGLLLTVIIGSGLGLYYYLRIIVAMSMSPESDTTEDNVHTCAWASSATLTILTMLLLWLGVFPERVITLIQSL